MKSTEIGQWVNILANLGVIAGIVFLGIEIRQNQASLEEANVINRATATSTAVEYINGFRNQMLQDEELRRLWRDGMNGADLSGDALERFRLVCRNNVWTLVMLHERYDMLGLQSRARGAVNAMREFAQAPGGRDCWERVKPGVIDWGYESFPALVESSEP